jgi:hypothetical protein
MEIDSNSYDSGVGAIEKETGAAAKAMAIAEMMKI